MNIDACMFWILRPGLRTQETTISCLERRWRPSSTFAYHIILEEHYLIPNDFFWVWEPLGKEQATIEFFKFASIDELFIEMCPRTKEAAKNGPGSKYPAHDDQK
jgi:hypothetical protein